MSRILFINASANRNGNTAALAEDLLAGKEYDTLFLADYRIGLPGQELPGDQLNEIIEKMKNADILVFGAPLYWHNLPGSLRLVLDRFYWAEEAKSIGTKDMFFLFQGASPEKWMMDAGNYTMGRVARVMGMNYLGMATNRAEAKRLSEKLK